MQLKGLDAIRPGITQGFAPTNGLYSVWNWNKGLYDYYESPEQKRPTYGSEIKPPPMHGALGSALGENPDTSSQGIPRSAKYVGNGPVALGEMASIVPPTEAISPWIGVFLALTIPTALLWLTVSLGDFVGGPDDFDEED